MSKYGHPRGQHQESVALTAQKTAAMNIAAGVVKIQANTISACERLDGVPYLRVMTIQVTAPMSASNTTR